MKRSSTPITVRVGRREFVKLNVMKGDWRDIYNFILTLSWPQFAGLLLGIYVLFNLCFATLYLLGGRCIAGLVPGSFSDAFFFSVETLATDACIGKPPFHFLILQLRRSPLLHLWDS